MDFSFDPFNTHRLAVGLFLYLHLLHTHTHSLTHSLTSTCTHAACDDAKIRVWTIPEGGLTKTLTEPDLFLIGEPAAAAGSALFVLMLWCAQATRRSPTFSPSTLKPEMCWCQQDMMERSLFGTCLTIALPWRWIPSHSLYVPSNFTWLCYFYIMLHVAICCFMESRWNVPCYTC